MRKEPVHTSYLETREPSGFKAPEVNCDIDIRKREKVGKEEHRMLYAAVGKEYRWVDRLIIPEDELQSILDDEMVELHTLHVDGKLAGYYELDRRREEEVEISYLGLLPAYIGKGLGKILLENALDMAWKGGPERVWLHTCEWDHPGAIPLYLKAGFRIYDHRVIMQSLPDNNY
ncbi:MAG: GNAT family N-acetyltransferase [Candidatus Thermoplasmatota archaeon]|nr:GNAT family N-acetyltransferase [Candidatus Thermoplasmatota archaeon]